ncbi:MAG: B12-binding domain-containing radical SAM protein [Lachnospiraceae bacterium]|nr:B12-binding domain-containing radical SAM protein [Lachnospiraceae bacterium]
MKFVLAALNAKYIHTNPGLYSLRAYGAKYGKTDAWDPMADIVLLEYTINQRPEEILRDIYKQKPDVIGFSCYIWNIEQIISLVKDLHKLMPDLPIWLGGPEVSYRPDEVLNSYPQLTGIMIGEGEETFLELLQYYKYKSDLQSEGTEPLLESIRGVVIRKEDEIVYTPAKEPLDLNKIPFLYDVLSDFEHKIIYYESSRGCPFRCSYCLSCLDKKVRLRNMETVKRELDFFFINKVAQVKFIDRTFNCNRQHAMEIWRYIKEHDNGVTNFHFEIAADLLQEEELALLKTLRPGAVQMEIGVQTTNEDTLREICRQADISKLAEAVDKLHKGNNIHIHLDLIAGLPFEDYESFSRSFDDVYVMAPQQLQLGFLKVLKGADLERKCEEYGLVYTDRPPYEVLCTKWLSFEEVSRLKQIEEMVELYYNSSQFTYTLPYMMQFFDRPFSLFERLADFYEKKGCFVNTPSRIYRYEVLRQFAMEETACKMDLLDELLTMDVYLREDAKSRPFFAKDQGAYKSLLGGFYRRQKQTAASPRMEHVEVFWYDIAKEKPVYEKLSKEQYVAFDYHDRDPLTKAAAIRVLSEEELQDERDII